MNSAKYLVFGVSGQVGSSLQDLARTQTAKEFMFCDRAACNLQDPASIQKIIRNVGPGVIINCAAYTAVDKAESEREQAMAINGHAPGIMAQTAHEIGALMVHYSTDYVFNGQGNRPWQENEATDPVNYYGATKLAGEKAVQEATPKHLILRTQWVYSHTGHNFLKTMLKLGADRPELKVVADQIGAPTSSAVIAKTTLDLIDRYRTDKDLGIYNLACGGETSWHHFAEEIFRKAKTRGRPLAVERVLPIPSKDYPTPAVRPLNSRLDLTKIERQLGRSMPTWQNALDDVLNILCGGSN